MYFTQEQVDTIQLPIRGKRLKLEVLNNDFQTIATIEGIATGGSLSKDATAFLRRSGSIQMCVPNITVANTFIDYVEGVTINVNGKIWLDKNVKVWTGIDNYQQPYGEGPKTVWYNFGICLIDQPVRSFSSDGYTLSFNLIDLAAKLNGDRSGQLVAQETLIPRVSGYASDARTYLQSGLYSMGCAYCDYENMYMGSSSGIYKYKKSSNAIMLYETPYAGTTYAIGGDYDNVYCGGDSGYFAIFNKSLGSFGETLQSPLSGRIYSIFAIGNNVCICGIGGICLYDKETGTFSSLYAPSFTDIYTVCAAGNYAYCGGYKAMAIFDMRTLTFGGAMIVDTPKELEACVQTDEIVYFGSGNKIAVFDKYTQEFSQNLVQTGLSGDIKSISLSDLYIYCGAYNEIAQISLIGEQTHVIGASNANSITGINWDNGLFCTTSGGDIFKIMAETVYTETESALRSILEELTEFKRYTIYPIPQKWAVLPYDIKLETGDTIYSMLEKILEILSGWQMYFDNEGVFVIEPIPSGANDIVYPLDLRLNISDVNSVDFNNVRNQVVVYGRSHNMDFYTEEIEMTASELVATFTGTIDPQKFQVGSTIIGFHTNIESGPGVQVGDYVESFTFKYGDNGDTTLFSKAPISWYGTNEKGCHLYDGIYVVRIKDATVIEDDGETPTHIDFTKPIELECLGQQQCSGCVVNGNPESPYYINKAYKGIAKYGEIEEVTYVASPSGGFTVLHISLTDTWESPQNGDKLTMFIPVPIDVGDDIRFQIYDVNGDIVTGSPFVMEPLTIQKIGKDYTIWEFTYDGSEFHLEGRCIYANPLIESGGQFDNIFADSLARERAEYDLFLHTNMQNSITLGCVPDYSLDVNYRIKYNQSSALPPDAVIDETFEDRYFITKQVTYPLGLDGSAQTVNAIEIYDDFNYVGYAYDLPNET